MPPHRELLAILFAGLVLCGLAGCQNTAGSAGNVPDNCAVPGSSCSRT